jgi:hypothetical protein
MIDSMKQFYTRQSANDGVRLPLTHPDGSESEHWICVRGVDSDHFRQAEMFAKRKAIEISMIENEVDRAEKSRDVELECLASLVASWSFGESVAGAAEFLKEAPQIADMINRFAVKRAEFAAKKPMNSANGRKQRSSLKNVQKVQKSG